MESFGGILRRLRKRAAISQRELAERVGLHHSYISKIERGVYSPPSRDKISAIAEVLGLRPRIERTYFLLAAGRASLVDLQGDQEAPEEEIDATLSVAPLSVSALGLPKARQIEIETLVNQLRSVLERSSRNREDDGELIEVARSFVEWLEFKSELHAYPDRDHGRHRRPSTN